MSRDLAALANQEFDLLVIGGGIFGAGIARDAALRGLRVALVERSDFASGTSSRSTKLIHGGFRYLEQAAIGLVAESCRERHVLQEIAPHLVQPLRFVFVVYTGDARPLWQVRLGLSLYDRIARGRQPGPHQTLSAAALRAVEPDLEPAGLRGGVVFYDCAEDDARFCVENVLDAARHGAVCANYCEVTGFDRAGEHVATARVSDRHGGGVFDVRARVFVNAAGPWVERVAGLAGPAGDRVALSPTKGVHLVVPRLTRDHGVFFQARQDRRIIFVVPWLDGSLIGSTDTDYQGDPAAAATDDQDRAYLLGEARRLLPGADLTEAKIITTFAGVRPLLAARGQPSARSREHRIVRQGANLFSVAGGKYTTYRAIAERVTDRVAECFSAQVPKCLTAKTPLPKHRPAVSGEQLADCPEVWSSDVRYACDTEMALTLADVMRRRTPLALSRFGGADVAQRVAMIMAAVLGWDEAQTSRQVADYLEQRQRGVL